MTLARINAPLFFRQLGFIVLAAACLLLVPLLAMYFTDEVAWTAADFAAAAFLLVGTGVLYLLTARAVRGRRSRIALGIGLVLGMLLLWAELAVGIVGSPLAGS
jgi:hypothetical protein